MCENKNDLLNEELNEQFDELEEEVEDVEIVELTDDSGNILKFFLVGETVFDQKEYAFFMPAQEIDGLGEDEVVVFEKGANNDGKEELLPVEDHALLEAVYEQFCREMEDEVSALEAEELEGGCCCGHHHDGEEHECDCGCHHDGEEHECGCHHDEEGHEEGDCCCHGKGEGHKHGKCGGEGKHKGNCKKHNEDKE